MIDLQCLCKGYLGEWRRIVRSKAAAPSGQPQFRGVSFHKARGLWRAQVRSGKRMVHGGYGETREAAARAYDRLAAELHGDKAMLNFPDTTN